MPPVPAIDQPATDQRPGSGLQRATGWLRELKRFDDQRPSVPGEHWFAFGTGAALL
ncbi:hypothetical protein [uncultured Azohydromonas sp.]|jgi:hypothetical protein|uniref:hypothetical protein n=1 Tax=uncultured Azohydromonas sp. TaxID=487342 RepID=UPI002612154D|nr:hypothetical protein [uncultured Azohydromonas sp.]